MINTPSNGTAFGKPGIEPRWTRGNKDAVGTAYSASSRLWFTLSAGILNEVYYPTLDRPQIRDLQYLITDGGSGNSGRSLDVTGHTIQVAHKGDTWLAIAASIPFARRSCGYVGSSDGWTDLADNFWINGDSYWTGIQLDEVAFPIMLAWRLHEAGALRDFDPYPMVLRAASYLVRQGPATPQERWEENSGYFPSTLASNIAALTCAASFARGRGDEETATFLQQYADFLECHVEPWTVTTAGTLVPEIPRHFIRIHPVDVTDPEPKEDPNVGTLLVKNGSPGQRYEFPAKEIIDAGFLELVRYGIRKPGDPLIEGSLRVVDALLKVDTPFGPCWRRYNHDGYGQRADGGPFEGWGQGRAWPLLTGERGHYEFAAGHDAAPYLRALEGFANSSGLLPEQLWDEPDRPEQHLHFGGPTGAAMPLMWAHAEYIRLPRFVLSLTGSRTIGGSPAIIRSRFTKLSKDRLADMAPQYNAISILAQTFFAITVFMMTGCGWSAYSEDDAKINSTPQAVADKRELIRDFTHLYVDSNERLPFTARFLGLQIMQNPADMWTIQEIISDVQPDFIIEAGTASGGSALFYATVLTSVNPRGRVITIDVLPRVKEGISQISSSDLRNRVEQIFDQSIEVIQSSSIDPKLVNQLAERTRAQRVLVILDSCHHSRHVLRELELYAPLVSKGSYLIAQDTIIDQKQEWIDNYAQCIGYTSEAGLAKAVADFLRNHYMEFEADASRERYLLTFCPGGFLKRK